MTNNDAAMKPYPIYLIGLQDRHCVVVGGGHEAAGKVRALLDCDATVTVISPSLEEPLQRWAEEGRFTWLQRAYRRGDLRGAFLVIAERDAAARNAAIWEEAEEEKALVNVMDDVEHCNFVAGSVVRQGRLVLSISTSGAAPALSVRLRQRMEQEFGPEYAQFLSWMQALREPMARVYPAFGERREIWYRIVDSDVLDLLRAGLPEAALARVSSIVGPQVAAVLAPFTVPPAPG
jgi:siroheme synthase-like protein